MSKVSVIVKLQAAAGKGTELAAAFEFAVENVLRESGTRYYIVHADTKDPDTLWIYEMYDAQADFDAHMGSDWFKEFGGKLVPLLGGAPEFHMVRPLHGKGV